MGTHADLLLPAGPEGLEYGLFGTEVGHGVEELLTFFHVVESGTEPFPRVVRLSFVGVRPSRLPNIQPIGNGGGGGRERTG